MTEESTQKWLISFNPNLIDKNSPADPKFFAQGFETYEVSCDEFLQLVTSELPSPMHLLVTPGSLNILAKLIAYALMLTEA